jgi:hypothetical protein
MIVFVRTAVPLPGKSIDLMAFAKERGKWRRRIRKQLHWRRFGRRCLDQYV